MSNHGGERREARGGYLALLTLGALGVVYGDIGTSPLYAFRESLSEAYGIVVDRANVLGVVSLIFWSLIVVITVKYLVFVMRADDHGEGGILALTSLITPRDPDRRSRRWKLILVGLFGTALLYGDGMITPSISVLSAVEGLEIVAPDLQPFVIPVAILILVALFTIQRRGTATVGSVFGPVMILWFGTLATLGILQILREPSVLAAVDPRFAVSFFTRNAGRAFLALGSVFLVVTGAEALYADMGHFGRRPIRLGWLTVVLPGLMLNYFGQGALLLAQPEAIESPFYLMAPASVRIPLVVLATAATVIASQALISGVFSLTMQAIQLGYLPRLRVDHTSEREFGQVYVGAANWSLMVACVGLVLGFGSSSNLAAAYGVAVTTTMVITTVLFYSLTRTRWRWSRAKAMALAATFLVVDLAFFGANILKVPAGGWFPLVVGVGVFTVMTTWRRGRAIVRDKLSRGRLAAADFVAQLADRDIVRVPGTGVFMFASAGATPPTLLENLRFNHVLHETVVLLTVVYEQRPRVLPAERYDVVDLGEGFFQLVLHFGYMDEPDVPQALAALVSPELGFDPLDTAYFLGRETLIVVKEGEMAPWREHLFAFLSRNVSPAARYFRLPPDRVIEIGALLEI